MKTAKEKLDNLTAALVEDILKASDEEILAEAQEDGMARMVLRDTPDGPKLVCEHVPVEDWRAFESITPA